MANTFPLVPDRIKTITSEYSTNIVKFENGREQRRPNWESSKATFKLTFKALTADRVQVLKDHFDDRKGSYLPFWFVNYIDGLTYKVRFSSDKFPLEYLNVAFADFEVELVEC